MDSVVGYNLENANRIQNIVYADKWRKEYVQRRSLFQDTKLHKASSGARWLSTKLE